MRQSACSIARLSILLGLLQLLAACASGESRSLRSGTRILDLAEQAVGMPHPDSDWQLVTDAQVFSGGDQFQTVIYSAPDGRIRMEQHPFEFLAGFGAQGSWYVNNETGMIEDAGPMLSFMRGHEMHMLALNPKSRLAVTGNLGRIEFAGVDALSLRFATPEGDSVLMHFDAASYLPLGLVLESQEPEITVYFSQWESAGESRVFKRAEIHQGDDVFRYEFTSVEIENLEPSIFEPPEL